MKKIILVVDIETTGFLNQGGKIVEIGIVKIDLNTGYIVPAYSSLIKEKGFDDSHRKGLDVVSPWLGYEESIEMLEDLPSYNLAELKVTFKEKMDEYCKDRLTQEG